MKIQKRHWFIIFSVITFVVGMEVLQYGRTLRGDIVVAVQTIPNPGHSWAEMESGPDSIQVSGRTITNLTAPINSTDATNKEYVDAAGGFTPTYSACYVAILGSTVSCALGYTTLAHWTTSGWVSDNADGATNGGGYAVSLGGGTLIITLTYCYYGYTLAQCPNYFGANTTGTSKGVVFFNTQMIVWPGITDAYPGAAVCCK